MNNSNCEPSDSEILARIGDIFSSNLVQIKTVPSEELMFNLEVGMNAERGICIVGNFRDGKNSALRFNLKKLSEYLGYHVGWCEISANYKTKNEEKPFVQRILAALEHEDPWSGNETESFNRLIACLLQRCDQSPRRRFVLWFDDVHRYRLAELLWILDISNEMDKRANLYTILTLPPRVEEFKQRLRETGHGDFVQRFALTPYRFRGLKKVTELIEVLHRFGEYRDPEIDFPSLNELMKLKTGKQYDLANLATPLWIGFKDRWKKKNLQAGLFELGMKWPCSATSRILQSVHARGWDGLPTPKEIKAAIDACGFYDALTDWRP